MTDPAEQAGGRASGPPLYVRRAGAARSFGAALVTALFLAPVVLLVSGSLRQPGLPPPPRPELVPDPVSPGNYERAIEFGGLVRATVNSVVVVAVAVPLSVLVAALAGFALTQVRARTRRWLVTASLVAVMVPVTALWVTRFAIFRTLGLTDTLVPLIAPALLGTSPFYVLVFALAFAQLPPELVEAAKAEGASPWQAWRRVAMPLVRPVTAAVAALSFIVTWSNFLDPLVYVSSRDLFTLPLALRSLSLLDISDHPLFLAGAVLATVPVLAVLSIAQRGFLQRHARTGWFDR